jgi:hypothetical protein
MSSSFLKVFPLLHGNLLLPCLTESQAALTSLKTTEGQTIIFILKSSGGLGGYN